MQNENEKNDIEINMKKQDSESNNSSVFDDNPNEGNNDFQNEDLYRDKNKKNDVFMLRKVTKVYGDGKMACNNISFNLFRNEIFALLGRNGAGKTSLINGKFKLIFI
jgi:ATPase subunit of ABC transporter with duplicated ATPase domains